MTALGTEKPFPDLKIGPGTPPHRPGGIVRSPEYFSRYNSLTFPKGEIIRRNRTICPFELIQAVLLRCSMSYPPVRAHDAKSSRVHDAACAGFPRAGVAAGDAVNDPHSRRAGLRVAPTARKEAHSPRATTLLPPSGVFPPIPLFQPAPSRASRRAHPVARAPSRAPSHRGALRAAQRSPSSPVTSRASSPPMRLWTRPPSAMTRANRISPARGPSGSPTSIASKCDRT